MNKLVSFAALAALLAGCADLTGSKPEYGTEAFGEEPLVTEVNKADDTYLLAAAPYYYVGDPYKVDGVQYIPAEDMAYNQIGVAGIIPDNLNGKQTSNNETYDSAQMLATSKTLPLPTIVRVTNLENGESVIVRVNNRGPKLNSRIMDLSAAAAEKLGMDGDTKVQIQVLPEQTMMVKNATLGKDIVAPEQPEQVAEQPAQVAQAPVAVKPAGEYSVQVAAFYAEDSANALLQKMRNYGDAVVVKEGDMFKVRIVNLDAPSARRVIDALRSNEGMAPGLLKGSRWVNADSI